MERRRAASMGMHTLLERQDMTALGRGVTDRLLRRIFERRLGKALVHNEHGVRFTIQRSGSCMDGVS